MNRIILNNVSMPVLDGCNLCAAAEAFYHADRITDFNILIYVIEGEIYVTEDEVDYVIGQGELLFLKSGVHHYGKHEIPKGTRWYFVHFFFDERQNIPSFAPDSTPIAQYQPVCYCTPLPKKLTGLTGTSIEKGIKDFIDYFHSSDNMKKWYINSTLGELLSDIAFYDGNVLEEPTLTEKICRLLNENYNRPFSAALLEKSFFLSYKYMAAVFKREKAMTMQQYHTQLRMTAAQNLLKSTLMSVGEISIKLGFSDMLYFSRCFRQFSGVSPTEYRKNASKEY